MKINWLLLLCALFAVPAFGADALPIRNEGVKPPYGQHGASREVCKADPAQCRQERATQREKWCAENAEKCREMKARAEQRRAACKADPGKCRQERAAKREKWCAENAEQCKEMKARAEQRRAACKADPQQCARARKARHEARPSTGV